MLIVGEMNCSRKVTAGVLVTASVVALLLVYLYIRSGISATSTLARSSVVARQLERQQQLHDACVARSGNNQTQDKERTGLVLSADQRLVYCVLGKVACTSWLRVLYELTDHAGADRIALADRYTVHGMLDLYLTRLPFIQSTQLNTLYTDYYKFLFVREPLERLLSGYRDKMFRDVGYLTVRRYIIERYRRHPTTRSLRFSDDVQFSEFVRYVIDSARDYLKASSAAAAAAAAGSIDHHWRPQYSLCRPCQFRYDFIGHYETLHDDARYVLQQLRARRNVPLDSVQFPHSDLDSHARNSNQYLQQFYANVSTYNILRLLRLYSNDYQVFGFKVPDVILQRILQTTVETQLDERIRRLLQQ